MKKRCNFRVIEKGKWIMSEKKSLEIRAVDIPAWCINEKDLVNLTEGNCLELGGERRRNELISYCVKDLLNKFTMSTINFIVTVKKDKTDSGFQPPEIIEHQYKSVGVVEIKNLPYHLIYLCGEVLHRKGESKHYDKLLEILHNSAYSSPLL